MVKVFGRVTHHSYYLHVRLSKVDRGIQLSTFYNYFINIVEVGIGCLELNLIYLLEKWRSSEVEHQLEQSKRETAEDMAVSGRGYADVRSILAVVYIIS